MSRKIGRVNPVLKSWPSLAERRSEDPDHFDRTMHGGRPNIGDRSRLRYWIEDLLDRRWLTNSGPYVQKFEKGPFRDHRSEALRRCVQRHRRP